MKVLISYHNIDNGAHMFATPEYTNSEIVEVESLEDKKLQDYIESKKDFHSSYFKKKDTPFMGFQYTSSQGGVTVEEYIEPNVKKL